MADGVAVPLKPLTDPRLNRQLTIQEFIEAFAIYKNVMCATYPHHRQELDFYERDIEDMSIRFGGSPSMTIIKHSVLVQRPCF